MRCDARKDCRGTDREAEAQAGEAVEFSERTQDDESAGFGVRRHALVLGADVHESLVDDEQAPTRPHSCGETEQSLAPHDAAVRIVGIDQHPEVRVSERL